MRAEPAAAEIVGESFGDFADRQAAGVGGDDRPGFADRFHLLQQSPFEFEILDHGLDDPVDVGQFLQIVVEIAHGDEARQRRFHEGRRLGFFRGIESGSGDLVARRALGIGGDDIQQVAGNSGVSEMGGDAGAHGSSAEDSDFIDALHKASKIPQNFLSEPAMVIAREQMI